MSDTDEPTDRSPGASPRSSGPVAPSALPSVGARVLAFAAIVLAGAAGGFIGYGVAELQCSDGDCTLIIGLSALLGAVVAAGGTAVVAVLTLRAMGEWHTIQERGGAAPTPDRRSRRAPTTKSGPPRVR